MLPSWHCLEDSRVRSGRQGRQVRKKVQEDSVGRQVRKTGLYLHLRARWWGAGLAPLELGAGEVRRVEESGRVAPSTSSGYSLGSCRALGGERKTRI